MMRGRALVLGQDSSALLGVIRSLGRAGIDVHVGWCAADGLALRSRYVRRRCDLPPFDEQDRAWLPALAQVLRAEAYDLVIPCDESSIAALQQHGARLATLARLYVLDDRAYDVLFDKTRTGALARALGIPTPRELVVSSAAQAADAPAALGFPLILKPHRTYNPTLPMIRRYVTTANSAAEFERALHGILRGGPAVLQQHFPGRGVGVALLMSAGRALLAFQHERIHEPLRGGPSSYRRSVLPDRELVDAAVRLLAAVQYTGVAMVEFKLDPQTGRWVLLEVNARFWGSLPLPLAAGCDFPLGLYQLLVHGAARVPNSYRENLYCRNWSADLVWQRANLRADRRDPTLHTRPLPAVARDAVLNTLLAREHSDTLTLDDPRPGLAELHRLARQASGALCDSARKRWWASAPGRKRAASRALRAAQRARRVLFICKGNICRSPFAERLLQKLRPDLDVLSAGYFPKAGRPSPPDAVAAAAEWDLDLGSHAARVVDEGLLQRFDVVFVFDDVNYRTLVEHFPRARHRVRLLGPLVAGGPLFIEDPWATNLERFRACYREIGAAVRQIADAAPRG